MQPDHASPPGWLGVERVGFMTWWLWVRSPVEANFLSGVFSPLTSANACEKSTRWLWKGSWCEKARKHVCVTDRHDMTLAVKVALNSNTTNQLILLCILPILPLISVNGIKSKAIWPIQINLSNNHYCNLAGQGLISKKRIQSFSFVVKMF